MTIQNHENVTQINPLSNLRSNLKKVGITQHQAVDLILYQLQNKVKTEHAEVYNPEVWVQLTSQLCQSGILTKDINGKKPSIPLIFSKRAVRDAFLIFWTTVSVVGTKGKNHWYNKSVWKQAREQINQTGFSSV